jgi:hypothetical protein
MKRLLFTSVLVVLAFGVAFVLEGCGLDRSSSERQEGQDPSAERARDQGAQPGNDPKQVGDAAEVGPLSVTLNDAKPY